MIEYGLLWCALLVCVLTIGSCVGAMLVLWRTHLMARRMYTEAMHDVARVANYVTARLNDERTRHDNLQSALEQFAPKRREQQVEQSARVVGEPGEMMPEHVPESGLRVRAGV